MFTHISVVNVISSIQWVSSVWEMFFFQFIRMPNTCLSSCCHGRMLYRFQILNAMEITHFISQRLFFYLFIQAVFSSSKLAYCEWHKLKLKFYMVIKFEINLNWMEINKAVGKPINHLLNDEWKKIHPSFIVHFYCIGSKQFNFLHEFYTYFTQFSNIFYDAI